MFIKLKVPQLKVPQLGAPHLPAAPNLQYLRAQRAERKKLLLLDYRLAWLIHQLHIRRHKLNYGWQCYSHHLHLVETLTFYPRLDKFENFNRYIRKVEAVGADLKSGIANIVAPDAWTPRSTKKDFYDADEYVIATPTEKTKTAKKKGVYLEENFIELENLKVEDFRAMANSAKHRNPVPHFHGVNLENYYFDYILEGFPIYGADTEGCFYEKGIKEWNMKNLGTILNELDYEIKEVSTAYLYFEMYNTLFPWHANDMDLYSINYLHFGAPKSYSSSWNPVLHNDSIVGKASVKIQMHNYLAKYRPNLHDVWDKYWYKGERFYWTPKRTKNIPKKRKANLAYENTAKRIRLGVFDDGDVDEYNSDDSEDEAEAFQRALKGYDVKFNTSVPLAASTSGLRSSTMEPKLTCQVDRNVRNGYTVLTVRQHYIRSQSTDQFGQPHGRSMSYNSLQWISPMTTPTTSTLRPSLRNIAKLIPGKSNWFSSFRCNRNRKTAAISAMARRAVIILPGCSLHTGVYEDEADGFSGTVEVEADNHNKDRNDDSGEICEAEIS
ncbi:hypothetical protein CAEBREN_09602 [Caenorhabditis brenneri]|uniref:JmjN domain-containing protein n=1 Tax=Caenorhabditis brenneri TaxID=135651 RepID=G0NDY6_CAEBE|nr:hypothetical protein CAEBREN_09602 [Caenorhabditis brenneri]